MIQSFQHIGIDPPGISGTITLDLRPDLSLVTIIEVSLSRLSLRDPTLEGIGEGDPVHGYLDPVGLGDDGVGDAGGGEDSGDTLQGLPDVASLMMDEVPLSLSDRSGNIVGCHLSLVKLPLEYEHRS